MLSEFDRDLAANHAGDIAENFDFDIDSTEAWEAAERAEAALEKVRALADRADARADASTRLVTTADLRAAIGGTP
ncbi:MAG TPA: hypothetical protein VFJ21_00190 [Mycobacteriales bacterium]|nr:hypothetical protein [Mycobacteriales bacterium]